MAKWTNAELDFLDQYISQRPIDVYGRFAQEFGADSRSYDAVQKQLKKLRNDNELAPADSAIELDIVEAPLTTREPLELDDSGQELLRRLQPQRLANRERAAENRMAADVFVDNLVSMSDAYRYRMSEQRTHDLQGEGSSLVILLSDTHCGKLTKYFNSDKFTERILSIPEKLSADGAVPADLQEIVVVLAGDMIEGEDIYHTQAHHIEHAVIDQVQIAVRAFWQLVLGLKDRYGVPIRVETCPGNHGRVSRTANGKSNWDNVIYQTLGITAEAVNDPNIVVNVNMENFYTFPVRDKSGLIYHHGTKHTGTPSMKAKLAGWLHNKDYDFMMHGHWHQWEVGTQFGRPIVKNGSLCGEDDLSEQMAVFDPPRQGYLVVRDGKSINQFGFLEWENVELN
jgi:hypothetical protein